MTRPIVTTDPARAAEVLMNGGIIGMPTETVYGLAARALDEQAVHRVFDVKGRPRNHPLIVHLSADVDPGTWGIMNAEAEALAERFWPGPLTVLVPRTAVVPDWVTGGRATVALRVPSHPVCARLLDLCADGIVAPSANRFGSVSPTTAQHVLADLGDDVDLVLDGGPSSVGVESTIVECIGVPQVLRPGVVSADEVASVVGAIWNGPTGDARAPGMLSSHYAPRARLILAEDMDEAQVLVRDTGARLLWHDDAVEYARLLYADLRAFDDEGATTVVALLPAPVGVGTAIRDRLAKAAAPR